MGHEASQGRVVAEGGAMSLAVLFFSQLRSFNHSTSAHHVKICILMQNIDF